MPRPWRAAARYGTSLLQEGQRGYAVLGQLYARVKLFEGYSLQGTLGGKDGEPALRYGGGEVRLVSSARRPVLFAAQYTDERSVGGDLLKGYGFRTDQLGVKTEASYAGAGRRSWP